MKVTILMSVPVIVCAVLLVCAGTSCQWGSCRESGQPVAGPDNINDVDNLGNARIHYAVSEGSPESVKDLLDRGADPNLASGDGSSPLARAIMLDHLGVVQVLLAAGADPDPGEDPVPSGNTLLALASVYGHRDIVAELITAGADVDRCDVHGFTALRWAALHGRVDVAELLLSKGADVNARDGTGRTPLHWAAGGGRDDVVTLLMERGAAPDVRDGNGHEPADFARQNGHYELADRIRSR